MVRHNVVTLPAEQASQVEDVRSMIDCFKLQFGNPRIVSTHDPLMREQPGAAALLQGENPRELQPTLLADGCTAPRARQVRLVAHETEHARHISMHSPFVVETEFFQFCAQRVVHVVDFQQLRWRVHQRVVEIRNFNEKLLYMNREPQHYETLYEILSRLRAYQVYRQQGEEAEGTEAPHEFLGIFTEMDLQWLDNEYLRDRCADISISPSPGEQIARRRPR